MMKKVTAVLAAFLLLTGSILPVFAAEEKGTLSIHYKETGGEEAREQSLEGLQVTLYYIGTSGAGGILTDEFQNSEIGLENLEELSVTEQKKVAKDAVIFAKESGISGQSKVTESDGNVEYEQLAYGVYLVSPDPYFYVENGSFQLEPFFVSLPAEGKDQLELTPKTKWIDGIEITAETLSAYSGEAGSGEEADGFPEPRYVGIPEGAEFKVNGETWTEDGYPFSVYYTYASDAYGLQDSGEIAENDSHPGIYITHIRPIQEDAVITCSVPETNMEQKVRFQNGTVIIREIDENQNKNQSGTIVSDADAQLSQDQMESLRKGVGVAVIREDSVLTVNGRAELGYTTLENVGLLFDNLLDYGITDADSGAVILEERAKEQIRQAGKKMENRRYQAKYLDLVDKTDGNLWIASEKGIDVYWPYPEGTDKNTEFDLLHFTGLHREYGLAGNPDLQTAVETAPMEHVQIEKTKYGIRFHIPKSGFSPFVLSWCEQENTVNTLIDSVRTGDTSAIAGWVICIMVSGGIIVLGLKKYRKLHF